MCGSFYHERIDQKHSTEKIINASRLINNYDHQYDEV